MHAERLALLTAVYGQSHSQVNSAHVQATSQFKGQTQNFTNSYLRPIPSGPSQTSVISDMTSMSLLPGYPLSASSSNHRSGFPSEPAPVRRTSIPSLSVSTSATNSRMVPGSVGGLSQAAAARRAVSSPESAIGPGSIVYQTPPSPAATRPPVSFNSPLTFDPSPTRAGSLLPSFLKQEVQPLRTIPRSFANTNTASLAGSRSPASLSPASSASADLPFEDQDGAPKSVGVIGSGRSTGFYAHPRGAGSGSSMGSSSSLTLGGGSIWSFARDEDKAWNNNVLTATEAVKGLTL